MFARTIQQAFAEDKKKERKMEAKKSEKKKEKKKKEQRRSLSATVQPNRTGSCGATPNGTSFPAQVDPKRSAGRLVLFCVGLVYFKLRLRARWIRELPVARAVGTDRTASF